MRTTSALALLCVLPFAWSAAQMRNDHVITIVHGTLIDGQAATPVPNATVIIQGNTIQYAGPATGITVPDRAQIIDAAGKTVMPGLADMHVHLQGAWDGTSVDLLGYQRYLNALLYAGVTTILDTGNYQPWVLQLRQEQAAGRLLGPRIYCVGAMLDAADPAWPDLAYAVSSRYQIEEFVQRDKRSRVDLIKAYVNLSDRMLHWLAEAAAKEKLRVIVDQWERNGSPDLVGTGIAGFAHAPTRKMSPDDINAMKARGVFVITTLAVDEAFTRRRFADMGFLREALIADTTPPWFLSDLRAYGGKPQSEAEKQETARAAAEFYEAERNVKKLADAGILLAAGTDAPYPGVFQGEGIHHELELLVEAGMTPLEAIHTATFNAARIIGAENEWGRLQAGRRANILIIAGHPDQRISDTRKVETVILEGRIVDRPRLRFDPKSDAGFHEIPGLFRP